MSVHRGEQSNVGTSVTIENENHELPAQTPVIVDKPTENNTANSKQPKKSSNSNAEEDPLLLVRISEKQNPSMEKSPVHSMQSDGIENLGNRLKDLGGVEQGENIFENLEIKNTSKKCRILKKMTKTKLNRDGTPVCRLVRSSSASKRFGSTKVTQLLFLNLMDLKLHILHVSRYLIKFSSPN